MRNKSAVIYVANTDWYLYNFRRDLIDAAISKGWEPLLVCPAGEYNQKLSALGYRVLTLDTANKGIRPIHEIRTLLKLIRIVRRERPEILHLFTLKCVLLGCLASLSIPKCRPIAAITGMGYLFTSTGWRVSLLKRPFLVLLRAALKFSDAAVIFQNEFDRDECVARNLVAHERTTIIRGSGVDCEKFKPDNSVSENTTPILLFTGRLLREKGIYEYLEATKALRDQGYAFISRIAGGRYAGNPSSLTQYEVEALEADPAHEYLGHQSNMPAIIADADVVVLPTYREGTPKSLLEAAAMAKIIVTTDIPGCRGVVEPDVNGYLVPPRDVNSLEEGLKQALCSSPHERTTMGLAGREIMLRHFSNTAVSEATLEIYRANTADQTS